MDQLQVSQPMPQPIIPQPMSQPKPLIMPQPMLSNVISESPYLHFVIVHLPDLFNIHGHQANEKNVHPAHCATFRCRGNW